MKRFFLIFLAAATILVAKSSLISPIPLPKTYIQDLDPYSCDDTCLKQELENGMIFSFLSHSSGILNDKQLNDQRLINISLFNIGSPISNGKLKIALLLPYKIIGRYAASTTTSVFAYLLAKNRTFDIKSFNIDTENQDMIASTLNKIEKEGYLYVIAPLTKEGVNAVIAINPKLDIYFPTINKKDVNSTSPYLYFGGIDYQAQLNALLEQVSSPLVVFHDDSPLSYNLSQYAKNTFLGQDSNDTQQATQEISSVQSEGVDVKEYKITNHSSNLKYILKDNQDIQHGSFLMNTPVIKTGMIMSQLTLYDVNSTNILSTQINYDPLILSMTQYQDRQNMIIANSVTLNNSIISETNALLSNDIVYNWINYATTIGVDYFFHLITNSKREYPLPIVDNHVVYPIQLVQPSYARFVRYLAPD